jgi:predicted GTPase
MQTVSRQEPQRASGRQHLAAQDGSSPLRRVLDRIPRELLEPDEAERVEAVGRRLAETRLYVVALGEFKRGKSSLLDALLGADYLPIGIVPLTAVVTMVRRGPLGAVAEFQDGRREQIPPEDLRSYVTEAGNPGNIKGLRSVELTVPSPHLPEQAVLVDTPGLGSVYETGTEHTLAFLPQVDVALLVLSVDQTFTEAERQLAVQLREGGTELLLAVNKADFFDGHEIDEALSFLRRSLADVGLADTPVFPVSAKRARTGQADGGIEALRRHLTMILERRYETILTRQSSRRIARLLDELQTSYSVRNEIARRSVDQLEQALARIEQVRARVRQTAEDQDAVFAHKVKQIERRIGERAAAFQAELQAALEARLPQVQEELGERATEHTIDEAFYQTIAERLKTQGEREGVAIAQELRAAAEPLTAALAEVAGSLADEAGAILGVSIARPAAPEVAGVAAHIDVKLGDDPVALETLAGCLQTALPPAVRRRLLLRRARERAAELANRHAGRLRSEVAAAARAVAQDVLRQAHAELNELQRSLDQAIARGVQQRSLGEAEAAATRARNERVLAAIAAVRSSLPDAVRDHQPSSDAATSPA